MKQMTLAVLVAAGLHAAASVAAAQSPTQGPQQQAQEQQRFEEKVDVKGDSVPGSTRDHFLTFDADVAVPGVTLPAGTYIFRFPLKEDLNSPSEPVIQVLRSNGGEAYAQFHSIPIRDMSRTLATESYDVQWRERQTDAPPAIQALFLPGQSTGYEFLYQAPAQ